MENIRKQSAFELSRHFWNKSGNILELLRTKILDNFGSVPERFRNMPGQIQEIFRKEFGKFPEDFQNNSEHFQAATLLKANQTDEATVIPKNKLVKCLQLVHDKALD